MNITSLNEAISRQIDIMNSLIYAEFKVEDYKQTLFYSAESRRHYLLETTIHGDECETAIQIYQQQILIAKDCSSTPFYYLYNKLKIKNPDLPIDEWTIPYQYGHPNSLAEFKKPAPPHIDKEEFEVNCCYPPEPIYKNEKDARERLKLLGHITAKLQLRANKLNSEYSRMIEMYQEDIRLTAYAIATFKVKERMFNKTFKEFSDIVKYRMKLVAYNNMEDLFMPKNEHGTEMYPTRHPY